MELDLKSLVIPLVAGAAVIAITALFLYIKSYRSPQLYGEAVFRVATDEKLVALTYDDGPSPLYTPEILRLLRERGAKATFFVLGSEAVKYPELIKKIYSDGHEIGNHSWTHEQLIFCTPSFVRSQIDRTDAVLKELGYRGPIPFRAPYGRKLLALPWVLHSTNRRHILFDVIPYDWERPGSAIIAERAVIETQPGSIILLHDGRGERSQTVEATGEIIDALHSQGYRFVTISELLETIVKK